MERLMRGFRGSYGNWKSQGKLNNFLWKAHNEILPTKQVLKKKFIVEDELCLVFMRDEESIIHILWNCPSSIDVWGNQDSPLRKWNSYFHDFKQLGDGLCRRLDDMILVHEAAICYKLWSRRNCFVFNNTFNGPSTLLRSELTDMEVYQDIHQCPMSNVDSMS